MTIRYIADMHFDHESILAYDNRPFNSVAEMNETMIANWNRVVVMYAGQCVEEASVGELLRHPAHCYTRALMRAVPGLHDDRSRRL